MNCSISRGNWLDVGSYPTHGEASIQLWRWEFLRRTSEYTTDYDKCAHEYYADVQAGKRGSDVRTLGDPANLDFLAFGLEEKYNLPNMPNPDNPRPKLMISQVYTGGEEEILPWTFFINYPLGPQIDEMKKYFESMKKNKCISLTVTRDREENWLTCLRLIDARRANAPRESIISTLRINTIENYKSKILDANWMLFRSLTQWPPGTRPRGWRSPLKG